MFKFPEKAFLFCPSYESIYIYYLKETNGDEGVYFRNYELDVFLREVNFEDNLFSPPWRFTLEEAQRDGERYIDGCVAMAEETLNLYKNHNKQFNII